MTLGQITGNSRTETPLTGMGNCPKQEGKVTTLLITERSAMYPLDKEAFLGGLSGYPAASGALRMYPVSNIVGMTIEGGDVNAPDLGTYGGPAPTNLNTENVAYQIDGGDCLYKELAKFNKRKVRVIRVDDEGYVYGTVVTKNGENYFAGFEATLYTTRTSTDGSTAYNLSLTAYYTPNYESELRNMNAFEAGLTNIPEGLVGIALKAGKTKGTATVVTACSGEDVTATYGDDWTTSMFVSTSGANPTSVAFDSATSLLTITPAGKYRIAPASILSAGDITGMEGVEMFAEITA